MMKFRRFLEICFILFFAIIVTIAAFVYFTGSTFGQRCNQLYPNGNALDKERCVEKLSHGVSL